MNKIETFAAIVELFALYRDAENGGDGKPGIVTLQTETEEIVGEFLTEEELIAVRDAAYKRIWKTDTLPVFEDDGTIRYPDGTSST